jgi:hypothetical protein
VGATRGLGFESVSGGGPTGSTSGGRGRPFFSPPAEGHPFSRPSGVVANCNWLLCLGFSISFFFLCGGGVYTARRKRIPEHHPRGKGGGGAPRLIIEAIRIVFVVQAVDAVGAPTTESWPYRSSKAWRARGRGVVAVVEQLVTDEGKPGEGRG